MSVNPPRLLAAMAAHLPAPRLLVHLLFVFLAVHVHVPASHAAPPPPLPSSYDSSICSESHFCGGVNISYPFYLADAPREAAHADYGNSYSCGYTDLKISCQGEEPNETPVINLGGENYTVLNIFYDNHTIVLADSEVLAGGNCPAVRHNVSFDELWLHHSTSFDSLTFFFGCYQQLQPGQSVPSEFDPYRIKCMIPPEAGPGYSFVLMIDELWLQVLAANCKEDVTVPVRGDVLIAATSNLSNFTSGGYGYVLKHGFELEWSRLPVTADQCHLCEESYGRCAYSTNREFMGCLCDEGKVGKPDCSAASSKS